MNCRLFVYTAAFLMGSAISTYAQDTPPQPQNHPPVLNPDRSVTFAIEVPNAKEVRFFADFPGGGKIPLMQRVDNNLWTYTTAPLEPGTYSHSFAVDGNVMFDPSNFQMVRDGRGFLPFFNNIEIRSGEPLPHDPNPDIPHGTV